MKVYLAARYSRREELAGYADKFRELGYEVTARWLEGNHKISDTADGDNGVDSSEADALRAQYAQEDVEDVMAADIVVSFTEGPGAVVRGGRHVEFGIGYASGAEMFIVGPRENIFHWLDGVRVYDTLQELLDSI